MANPTNCGNHDPVPSRILSMSLVLESHDHALRLTIREREVAGRARTVWRVFRANTACRRCRALSGRLVRSSREFRARISKLLVAADGTAQR